MKPPLAKCPKCKGTGKFPIGSGLLDALTIIKSHGHVSATEIHELIDGGRFITVTAINQRLEDLRKLGLVDRERRGREFVYFVAKQEDK